MLSSQKLLLDLFCDKSSSVGIETRFSSLDNLELAQLFVDISYLLTALQFAKEQSWLDRKKTSPAKNFTAFLQPYLRQELLPVHFFLEYFDIINKENFKQEIQHLVRIETALIHFVLQRSTSDRKVFLQSCLNLMSQLFQLETQWQEQKKSENKILEISLYRTFDLLDRIFDIQYSLDSTMQLDPQVTERLYQGGGVGVQSGYSTILNSIKYLTPNANSSMIDLGSGYGRVGFVIGLLRPDIQFTGYEYVSQRVENANAISSYYKMDQHVNFITQDLSQPDFKIPIAQVYYLYDPFSEETYQYILRQLVEISHMTSIQIVTKGNARAWFYRLKEQEQWDAPVEIDNGNLCIFQTSAVK